MWKWLKHAFAIETADSLEVSDVQKEIVEKLCRAVVKRHLTVPALMALETVTPLNYLGSQALHFFSPFLTIVTDKKGHEEFARFLEQRGSIDYICERLEALEEQARKQETPVKKP